MRLAPLAAGLCGSGLLLSGFAPATDEPRLPYQLEDLTGPVEPEAAAGAPVDPATAARRAMRNGSYLTVDLGLVADSNITNQTGLHAVDVIFGGETVPIELDPAYRERSGFGQSLAMSAGARLPVADKVAAAIDADAAFANFDGKVGDDLTALLAFGPEVTFDPGSQGAIQAFAYGRSFGGIVVARGVGLRGRYQQGVGEKGRVYLYVDGRIFESDYGDEFGGRQASVYLTYEELVDPSVSVSVSGYARREALGADAFSNLDAGIYGGVSAFLPLDLKGGFTASLSRIWFDDPLIFYSPDPRRDWRYGGSLWLMPRKPVGPGLWPSISYSYTRNDSTLQFYRTDRHRLRLGVARYW